MSVSKKIATLFCAASTVSMTGCVGTLTPLAQTAQNAVAGGVTRSTPQFAPQQVIVNSQNAQGQAVQEIYSKKDCEDAKISVRSVNPNFQPQGDRQAVVTSERTGQSYLLMRAGDNNGGQKNLPLVLGGLAGGVIGRTTGGVGKPTAYGIVLGVGAGLAYKAYKNTETEKKDGKCARAVAAGVYDLNR